MTAWEDDRAGGVARHMLDVIDEADHLGADAGLLHQLADGRLGQGLAHLHPASGKV